MLIDNTGQSLVIMNLRTGEQVQLPPGQRTPLADSKIQYIDDSAVLIALFNAGVLIAYNDAGAAYPGFPTSANPADSKVVPPVDPDYANAVLSAAGSRSLLQRVGSVANPIATLTGNGAAQLFGSPLAGLRIPAGLIIPGRTKVRIEGYWYKTGSTAAAVCACYLGTTNSLSDSLIGNQSIGPAATSLWRQYTELFFADADRFTESYNGAVGAPQGAQTTSTRTTNINTAANMFLNWGSSNAAVGDGLLLLSAAVSVFT